MQESGLNMNDYFKVLNGLHLELKVQKKAFYFVSLFKIEWANIRANVIIQR